MNLGDTVECITVTYMYQAAQFGREDFALGFMSATMTDPQVRPDTWH